LWVTADLVFAEALQLVAMSDRYEILRSEDLTIEAILQEVRDRGPRVVFLDLERPAVRAPADRLVALLRSLGPRVVVLAPHDAVELRSRCLRAGADGFASRADSLEGLLDCVARATRGERLLAPAEGDALLRAAADIARGQTDVAAVFDLLSAREQEVLRELMRGRAAKQIARDLVVSLATIRSHIRAIITKLGVRSQIEAVVLARRAG
jgi:DNA-binding NarL/FixJ family response regulator